MYHWRPFRQHKTSYKRHAQETVNLRSTIVKLSIMTEEWKIISIKSLL